ncbi:MAG TPA: ATP-binding protein [Chloroflexaceae bacterium]|nr:ATP-binding protein [Chloroflexaceae bacterium]
MRPRIFSLMLTAFALVIVLGIGGMLSIFALAVLSFQRGDGWGPPPMVAAQAEARQLAEFYDRRGSWAGVEQPFAAIERGHRGERWRAVTLLDAEGRVVRSSLPDVAAGAPAPPVPPIPPDVMMGRGRPAAASAMAEREITVQSVPIELRGEQVGALLVVYDGDQARAFGFGNLARGLLGAGLALAAILLALAAFFSSRISTPLRQLNGAAMAMAAGDMRVRVRPGAVREVADLAVSFNGMADALARADQQRRQLTADVAHELRTPLSIIKGRLEGVQDGVYRADPEQIAGLLAEVALLERLIEDLRVLALADAGQLHLFPEAADPARLAADAARSFAPQAAERGVRLRAEAAPGLSELSADPQRIAQVLGNLVSNALRHTPAGGEVVIAVRPDQGPAAGIVFEVRDSGAGISAEELPRIFDRFYRADRSRSRGSGGAGLGLAIARRLVEAHGGAIWAASEPGRGTTVAFRLPA